MKQGTFTIEEINDPAEAVRAGARDQRMKRNGDWLQAHWTDLLPGARGKFLVIANQEAFIADTPEEAWALAHAAHPEDDGAFGRYVFPEGARRIYDNHR